MKLSDFDYPLPASLIARHPPERRDGGRLLYLPLDGGPLRHLAFVDLAALLRPGDLVVLNDSRVFKARLRGRKAQTGGEVELLLERPAPGAGRWYCLGNSSKGFKLGQRLEVAGVGVTVAELLPQGRLTIDFGGADPLALAAAHGELPLPPYFDRPPETADAERYQTVYARAEGSVAAPTAGLHFTESTFQALRERGVATAFITLNVGPGTFLPVRAEEIAAHQMLEERFEVPAATAAALERTRAAGGRVVAVGTTVTRTLETAALWGSAEDPEAARPQAGLTDLFIRPGHRFRAIDGLLTNFHLPKSTLLMLVAALAGRERVLSAYAEAIARGYRFFSYGDCCLFL